jgi:hypothetical protein
MPASCFPSLNVVIAEDDLTVRFFLREVLGQLTRDGRNRPRSPT